MILFEQIKIYVSNDFKLGKVPVMCSDACNDYLCNDACNDDNLGRDSLLI